MSENRIYVTVNKETRALHSISIMGEGKVRRQIDYRDHKGMGPHVHDWTYPGGKPRRGDARELKDDEHRLFDKVNTLGEELE
ncbi:hypothetical protein KIH77_08780 [Bifidobacterium sp. 82T24]|uniref:hypothetical protein n=1 Tax=Bifidobacterium pluvialisilvae TaxID=2834436 RepID=UPI001C559CF2|nr:hypothetical protein [Bifidobacterium pluvialisilvae]MBW3088815.1 hypothetical protein [Bifidobacterium pluvialisilvae]